jgi:hypothetical protein
MGARAPRERGRRRGEKAVKGMVKGSGAHKAGAGPAGRLFYNAFAHIEIERTMPVSKHSHSGMTLFAFMPLSISLILETEFSNIIGGQAHLPSLLIFR